MIKGLASYFERLQQANTERFASVHWGDFASAWSSGLLRYPNLCVYSVNKVSDGKMEGVELTITVSDIVRDVKTNLIDVENSTYYLARAVFDVLRKERQFSASDNVNFRFFKQSGGDVVAGHTFTMVVSKVAKDCNIMELAPCRELGDWFVFTDGADIIDENGIKFEIEE